VEEYELLIESEAQLLVPCNDPVNEPVNEPVVYELVNKLNDEVVTNEPVLIVVPPPFIAYEAVIAYDAVPNKLPVNDPVNEPVVVPPPPPPFIA
jgi:hypothetical protein